MVRAGALVVFIFILGCEGGNLDDAARDLVEVSVLVHTDDSPMYIDFYGGGFASLITGGGVLVQEMIQLLQYCQTNNIIPQLTALIPYIISGTGFERIQIQQFLELIGLNAYGSYTIEDILNALRQIIARYIVIGGLSTSTNVVSGGSISTGGVIADTGIVSPVIGGNIGIGGGIGLGPTIVSGGTISNGVVDNEIVSSGSVSNIDVSSGIVSNVGGIVGPVISGNIGGIIGSGSINNGLINSGGISSGTISSGGTVPIPVGLIGSLSPGSIVNEIASSQVVQEAMQQAQIQAVNGISQLISGQMGNMELALMEQYAQIEALMESLSFYQSQTSLFQEEIQNLLIMIDTLTQQLAIAESGINCLNVVQDIPVPVPIPLPISTEADVLVNSFQLINTLGILLSTLINSNAFSVLSNFPMMSAMNTGLAGSLGSLMSPVPCAASVGAMGCQPNVGWGMPWNTCSPCGICMPPMLPMCC